jgi:hypothetical protein
MVGRVGMLQCLAAMLAMPAGDVVAQAVESPRPLAIEDLYKADQSLDGVSIDDGRAAV